MATSTITPAELPSAIRSYLAAGDADVAVRAFTPAAVVTDEGHTFRGTQEILGFLRNAGGEFTFTIELIGAERVDAEQWVAINRLEGDFPGGVVELRFRFTLAGDLVAALDIAP